MYEESPRTKRIKKELKKRADKIETPGEFFTRINETA